MKENFNRKLRYLVVSWVVVSYLDLYDFNKNKVWIDICKLLLLYYLLLCWLHGRWSPRERNLRKDSGIDPGLYITSSPCLIFFKYKWCKVLMMYVYSVISKTTVWWNHFSVAFQRYEKITRFDAVAREIKYVTFSIL